MGTINRKDRITRRGFLELSSAALATTGLLADVNVAKAATGNPMDTVNHDSALMTGKIALEEHFALPETDLDSSLGYTLATPELRLQIQDMGGGRIAEMDRGAVELCILSLVSPGIQAIPSISQAIDLSR